VALSLNPYALVDWVQIGNPLIVACCNGIDQPWWTDGLETGRSEATLSTTAPDTSGSSAADANVGTGVFPDATTYTIYITYVRAASTTYPSMESGPCDGISHTTSSDLVDIALSDLPVSGDAQVTHKNIYMIGGALSAPFYVDQIANATTSYTIEDDTDTIGANATMDEASVEWPSKRTLTDGLPPIFERIEYWNGRLWGAAGATVHYSRFDPDFEDFPSNSPYFTNSNSIPINRSGGGLGAKITQLRAHKGYLYVFFEDAVYIISGDDQASFRVDPMLQGEGHSGGPHSVISRADYLYYMDRQKGPRRWAGTGEPDPSYGIALQDFWTRVDKMRLPRTTGIYSPATRELMWAVTEGRYDRPNRLIVYDEVTQTLVVDRCEMTSAGLIRNEVGEKAVLMGNCHGQLYQYDIGSADGVYTGTTSGTPTTSEGVTLADTTATFGAAADVEGRPLYELDSAGTVVRDNRVFTRAGATSLRLSRPMHPDIATYLLGEIPVRRTSGYVGFDPDGPSQWQRIEIRYVPTTASVTVYVDLKDRLDSDWTNIGSFDTYDSGAADGRHEIPVGGKRGEDMQFRLRWDDDGQDVQIIGVTIKASFTGGS